MRIRHLLALFSCLLGIGCAFSASAIAAPGAYKVLLAEVYEAEAKELGAQIAAFPDVATVDYVNTGEDGGATPTAAQLAPYDIVVSIGDSNYLDAVGWGNSLADFIDQGGVVVQAAYDNWDGGGAPLGRFESGDYPPFIPGDNVNDEVSLGEFDAASPLMQGVVSLTSSELNTAPNSPLGRVRSRNGTPATTRSRSRVASSRSPRSLVTTTALSGPATTVA